MKKFAMVFVLAMIFGPFTAFANDKHQTIDNPTMTNSLTGWSVEDHMAAAKSQEQEAQKLVRKIETLVKQISDLTQKPYLDPKSLRRDSLMRISGNLIGKLRTLQTQIAWHQKEAAQLTAMNEKHQNES